MSALIAAPVSLNARWKPFMMRQVFPKTKKIGLKLMLSGQRTYQTSPKNSQHTRVLRKGRQFWVFRLCFFFSPLLCSAFSEGNGENSRLNSVFEAFLATDADKEKNLLCKGPCHLPKLSSRITANEIANQGAQ